MKEESFKLKAIKTLKRQKILIFMILPFLIWLIVFHYIPLFGWIMAFQNYKPGISIWQQQWVGLKHFKDLFADPQFYNVMKNTLGMSFMQLVFGFPIPIIFAILLNEIKNIKFKKTIQTISYLPHFVSWVIVASLVTRMLSMENGIINEILLFFKLIDSPIQFMAKPQYFWWISTFSEIWKELGWNAIIFLAAISGIDPTLYEAAKVDGANRWHNIWYITLPSIMETILVVLVLNIGWIISIGFEKQMLLSNNIVIDKAQVLDLYTLKYGIQSLRYSYGTAIGMFKSVISVILLILANRVAKLLTGKNVI